MTLPPVLVPTNLWEQDTEGWWILSKRRILRIDLQCGLIHVAANVPYAIDIDLAWLMQAMGERESLRVKVWRRWREWFKRLTG